MTLFWRLFLSIFAALMLTAGTVAYITHEFRDVPSSEIDPGGAQVLGRTASVVQRGLEEQGLESIRQMQRSRLRPICISDFKADGNDEQMRQMAGLAYSWKICREAELERNKVAAERAALTLNTSSTAGDAVIQADFVALFLRDTTGENAGDCPDDRDSGARGGERECAVPPGVGCMTSRGK